MKFFSFAFTAQRWFCTKGTNFTKSSFNNCPNYVNPRPRTPKIRWNDQQRQIMAAVMDGKSVFITGSGGTGKTLLVKHLIEKLKKIHGKSRVAVTASTGLAACNIRGQTLHSFAGIGVCEGDRETLLERVIGNRRAYARWKRICVLVIDEISMVHANVFDSLEYIARKTREKKVAHKEDKWGGLQLVVSGDFFQLPPVINQQQSKKIVFAFEAGCWDSSFDLQVELIKVFRQSEGHFIELLQRVRRGVPDTNDLKLLEQYCSGKEPDSSAVQIYPTHDDVHRVNMKQLESVGEEIIEYHAFDRGRHPWVLQLQKCIAPDELQLCIGARVMLIWNMASWKELVNGATGTVTDFAYVESNEKDFKCKNLLPVVKFDSGQELLVSPVTWNVMDGDVVVASRKQIPLILAWALSIHKCQGMTIERIHTDLSRAFGFGMMYVALSRVKNLTGLHISSFNPSKIMAHPKVLHFYERFACEKKAG